MKVYLTYSKIQKNYSLYEGGVRGVPQPSPDRDRLERAPEYSTELVSIQAFKFKARELKSSSSFSSPLNQKLSATPKSGAYDFCSFKTVELVKIFQNVCQIHSFEATKTINPSFWGSSKFLIDWFRL